MMSAAAASQYCRPWLPETALDRDRAEKTIAQAVEAWSTKWIARRSVRIAKRTRSVGTAVPDTRVTWRHLPRGLAVGIDNKARLRLAGFMLDASIDERNMSAEDRLIIETIVTNSLVDLEDRLASAFRLEQTMSWAASDDDGSREPDEVAFEVGPSNGASLLQICISRGLLIEFIKKGFPPPPTRPLRDLSDALARQEVRVAAFLGECSLSLADFSRLAEGDVIVLDQSLESPLPLVLNEQSTSGSCTPQTGEDSILLKIVEPFFG